MKKVTSLMLGLALLLAVGFKADWAKYRTDSDLAKDTLNRVETLKNLSGTAQQNSDYAFLLYGSVLHNYNALAEDAKELGREDLQAWAKNNEAYAAILYFKWLVKYDERNATIEALSPKSKERLALVKELQEAYVNNIDLLKFPESWLDEADELSSEAKLTKRTTSNRDFIVGVKALIAHKF